MGLLHITEKETFIVEYYVSGKKMPEMKDYLTKSNISFSYQQTGLCFTFYVKTNLYNVSEIQKAIRILKFTE